MYNSDIESLLEAIELFKLIGNDLKRETRGKHYENTNHNYSPGNDYPAIRSQFMRR